MKRPPDADRLRFVEAALCEAIEGKRLVAFTLDGCHRVAEPHDYGIVGGQKRLFFFQVGGVSRSGRPAGWRWAALDKIDDLRILDDRFPGSRPAPSGRHQRWDAIIASVSVPPTGEPPAG